MYVRVLGLVVKDEPIELQRLLHVNFNSQTVGHSVLLLPLLATVYGLRFTLYTVSCKSHMRVT